MDSRGGRFAACAGLLLAGLVTAGLASAPAGHAEERAGAPRAGLSSAQSDRARSGNPLANRPWAAYEGPGDPVWVAYTEADGETQQLLAKIALEPRTRWYGDWIPTSQVRSAVSGQIAQAQAGDPETLVPIADFRLKPWEHDACKSLPTKAEQADYKAWTREFAAGIGDAHVSVVLQPDGPFALCAPHHSKLPSKLIRFAAKTLSKLPNTSTYIDAGASDWLRSDPAQALRILLPAGVRYARGFALNGTHYASTSDQIAFGAAVVKALAKRGVRGKHFVVNTAGNGQPFNGYDYKGRDFDNAKTCRTTAQRHCVTLGIPPTADVANPTWGLSKHLAHLALKDCDGYQWIGRPWLFDQADPFVLSRALDVARTTPYASPVTVPPPPAPAPTVTGVSPSAGPTAGGTSVTITGTGFTGVSSVTFGGVAATSVTLTSATSLTATSPAHAAGPVDVQVVGGAGSSATSAADRFTYVAPAPTVTGISPSSGTAEGGTVVTVTGTGFTGVSSVTFGGVPGAEVTVTSSSSLTVISPAHSVGAVDVEVTNDAGTSPAGSADQFAYDPPPPAG